eukprot:TRINITY_DN1732_c0_g1_i1.p1 TRINITY_DN1732_c0_g1~~TRINITY_DN1732_c0_g1_i1.p1  ORF type:complete len:544 (+),score=152.38 TRINITY_DN1732_c0_g1_i1:293-1924(+)
MAAPKPFSWLQEGSDDESDYSDEENEESGEKSNETKASSSSPHLNSVSGSESGSDSNQSDQNKRKTPDTPSSEAQPNLKEAKEDHSTTSSSTDSKSSNASLPLGSDLADGANSNASPVNQQNNPNNSSIQNQMNSNTAFFEGNSFPPKANLRASNNSMGSGRFTSLFGENNSAQPSSQNPGPSSDAGAMPANGEFAMPALPPSAAPRQEIARARRGSLANTVEFAIASNIGKRNHMEDAYKAINFGSKDESKPTVAPFPPMNNPQPTEVGEGEFSNQTNQSSEPDKAITQIEEKSDYAYFGVYDGHGGNEAADFVAQKLHASIVTHPLFTTDTETAIIDGFKTTEDAFEDMTKQNRINGGVGTTACVGLIYKGHLYIANVGDSAAIICTRGQPVQLTTPHTIKDPSERQRVEKAGGVVYKDSRLGHPHLNSSLLNLGVTRAIGDFYFKQEEYCQGKPSGLIAVPEIRKIPLTTDDSFLLLASDGFWDVVSTRQAINYILSEGSKDLDTICGQLVDLAVKKATDDNTTVLLVKLKDLEAVNNNK